MNRVTEVSDQIITTSRLLDRAGNMLMSEFGITMSGYETLVQIGNGINTTTKLASRTNSTLANITHKTKILEEKGFIKREIGGDKRKWNFSLTDEGVAMLETVEKYYEMATSRLFSQFSDNEVGTVLDVLNRTREHLEFILTNESDLKEYVKTLAQKTRS